MSDVSFQALEDLFNKLVDLDPGEQEKELKKDCISPVLRERVRKMLVSDRTQGDFLAAPFKTRLSEVDDLRPAPLHPGQSIAGFIINQHLGAGSIADVYQGFDPNLGRSVALKVARLTGDEGKTLASLNHRSIVKVYSEHILKELSLRIICMEFIDGPTLESAFEDTEFLEETLRNSDPKVRMLALLRMSSDLVAGVKHAHDRHVIHADIKPSNILIRKTGELLLSDFNVAQISNSEVEHAGLAGGTPGYMSQDQRQALALPMKEYIQRVRFSWDTFSLARVLQDLWHQTLPPDSSDMVLSEIYQHYGRFLQNMIEKEGVSDQKELQDLTSVLKQFTNIIAQAHQLPNANKPLFNWANRNLFVSLAIVILFPQFVGSLINIAYNKIMIIDTLTPEQHEYFVFLLGVVNPITYSLCGLYIAWQQWKILQRFYKRSSLKEQSLEIYRRPFTFPRLVFLVSCLGWITGFLSFSSVLGYGSPSDPAQGIHLFISFALSWLIAATFSSMLSLYFMIAILAPSLASWLQPQLFLDFLQQLKRAKRSMGRYTLLAFLTPLIAATFLVAFRVGANTQTSDRFLLVFIAFAMGGALIALRIKDKSLRILDALAFGAPSDYSSHK